MNAKNIIPSDLTTFITCLLDTGDYFLVLEMNWIKDTKFEDEKKQ
jgi:hypothetical protein